MVERKSISRRVFLFVNMLLMIAAALICVIPIWHIFMSSISEPGLVDSNSKILLLPLGEISFKGYKYILNYKNLWVGYGNTIFYVVMQCLISGGLSLLAGYVLSRKRMKFRNAIMMFIAFTMLFNGGMVPTYMVVRNTGLLYTRAAMLIPSALSVFNIIIMRTAIAGIPDSLEESARLDGAGELSILFKIVIPLCKASFAVIILFTAVAKWNEWFSAILYLKDTSKYPLQMFLRQILIKQESIASSGQLADQLQIYKVLVKYCSIVVSTLPILCIYPFVQKHFVSGILIGSVKG